MRRWKRLVACGSSLNGLVLCLAILNAPTSARGQTATSDYYQDFRGKQTLSPFFKYTGADIDNVKTLEDEGLRITLPAARQSNQPVGVTFTEKIAGDFEVTGSYEMLHAPRPAKGGGSGVALNISFWSDMAIFAKLGRAMRVSESESFVVEGWNRLVEGNNFVQTAFPATQRTGQVRLKREGTSVRYLVAEPAGAAFKQISQRDDIGTSDTDFVRFVVNNQGDANDLSVRLVDFRIQSFGPLATKQAAGNAAPANVQKETSAPTSTETNKGWLAAGLIAALVVTLTAVLGLWLFLKARRREDALAPEPPSSQAEPLSFQCTACGKKLIAKIALAGKAIRCPKCGQAVRIPGGVA